MNILQLCEIRINNKPLNPQHIIHEKAMETEKIDVGEVAERLGRPVINSIRKTIRSKRKRSRVSVDNVGDCEKLSISYVIDNLPFSKMLSLGENAKPEDSIPFVTRAYEERYMRPAQNTEEDSCIMGDECECMHIYVCMRLGIH